MLDSAKKEVEHAPPGAAAAPPAAPGTRLLAGGTTFWGFSPRNRQKPKQPTSRSSSLGG